MIKQLRLKNFKVHRDAQFELKGLNLFTGKNGMGKSSILQALLLLRQSYLSQRIFEGLVLNGDLVTIGNYQDAFCESGDGDQIEFSITDNEGVDYKWIFEKNLDSNYLPLKGKFLDNNLEILELFSKEFQYIAAEHIAAQESHARNTFYVEQLNQISEKRGDGKYTVHYLSHYADKSIGFPELAHPKEKKINLKSQIEAWLNEISPSIRLSVEDNSAQSSVTLRYQYETELGLTKEYKPENVGFGVSYILPILVSILTAKKNSIILLENPEAHLHPAGQATIGRLLCLAAKCGIQLIVETHSDHIINSILVSILECKREINTGISIDDVRVYFINRNLNSHVSEVHRINIRDDARIIAPPEYFFDQFSKDIKTLIGF